MVVQLIIIIIAILLCAWFENQIKYGAINTAAARKKYIIILFVLMTLQSGLRNVAVGADTYEYSIMFMQVKYLSWEQIFNNYHTVYIDGIGKDPGYELIVKIFQLFSTDYQVYLFSISTLFFIALGRIVYRTTSTLQDVLLCVAAYQVLFYGFFSITGLRQTIATTFLLFSYKSIIDRKFLKFCIFSLIAIQIHKSALLFVPVYFFAKDRRPYTFLIACLCLVPIVFAFGRQIALAMTSFSFTESYAGFANSTYETSGAQMFMIFMLIISIMLLMARNSLRIDTNLRLSITAFSVGLMFTPLTWIDPSMMRAVMYFSFFLLFFIGKTCRVIEQQYAMPNSSLLTIMVVIFSTTIIMRGGNYAFFWQYMPLPSHY